MAGNISLSPDGKTVSFQLPTDQLFQNGANKELLQQLKDLKNNQDSIQSPKDNSPTDNQSNETPQTSTNTNDANNVPSNNAGGKDTVNAATYLQILRNQLEAYKQIAETHKGFYKPLNRQALTQMTKRMINLAQNAPGKSDVLNFNTRLANLSNGLITTISTMN